MLRHFLLWIAALLPLVQLGNADPLDDCISSDPQAVRACEHAIYGSEDPKRVISLLERRGLRFLKQHHYASAISDFDWAINYAFLRNESAATAPIHLARGLARLWLFSTQLKQTSVYHLPQGGNRLLDNILVDLKFGVSAKENVLLPSGVMALCFVYSVRMPKSDEGFHFCTQSIRMFPNKGELYLYRGMMRLNKTGTLYSLTLSDLDRALKLGYETADAFNARAIVHDALGHYGDAIADYNKAVRLSQSEPIILLNRSIAYRHAEDFSQALADARRALELDPTSQQAKTQIAELESILRRNPVSDSRFEKNIAEGSGEEQARARLPRPKPVYFEPEAGGDRIATNIPAEAPSEGRNPAAVGEEVTVTRSEDGHFRLDVLVNGVSISFLFDTGATVSVIDETDAVKMGIDVSALRFSFPVSTANGVAYYAEATAERMSIGPILLSSVPLLIGSDEQVGVNLLGMNVLNRLGGWRVVGDRLFISEQAPTLLQMAVPEVESFLAQ